MRKILFLGMFALVASLFTTSCDEDRDSNPVYRADSVLVLNVPGNAANHVYDLSNDTSTIVITTSQPNNGMPLAYAYNTLVSLDGTNFKQFGEAATTPSITLKAKDLNAKVIELNGDECPKDVVKLYVKVTCHLAVDATMGIAESNVIELNVRAFAPEVTVALPTNMYIVGSFAASNNWSTFVPLHQAYSQDGFFFGMVHLQDGAERTDLRGDNGEHREDAQQSDRIRTLGANMLADIVKPYGGIIIWRCFVYNCTQDWRDYKTDRARAGYDSFIGMDGEYHDNVILQIKNGPMDFQIREPVSPLLGGLKKTNQMLEVQVAQEYTGHQIDVCYLMPMFREILDFRTYCAPEHDCVKDIISGRTLGNTNTGIAAVINTGNDANWTGNELAAANFYGFGRLACETGLSPEEIAAEWISLTFGNDPEVLEKLLSILLPSRETYEKYTSPLGIGWMVTPHVHYGCSVDGYEYSRWGTYHRADHLGLGVDRSHKGTGYAGQYYEPNASMYDSMDTCPEELLLFFHHVPYIRKLKSGKTLIQHIYDTHFEGVCEVEAMISTWESLKDKIAPDIYANVSQRFARQLVNAKEWRDQVNSYFYRKSGIPDEKGRPIY